MSKYGLVAGIVLMLVLTAFAAGCTQTNQNPKADFTCPNTGKVDEVITFDASGSKDPDGKIAKYEWNFGDGQKGTGKQAMHAYTTEATYTVILKVTDDKGASAKKELTIAITKDNTTSQYIKKTVGEIMANPGGFIGQKVRVENVTVVENSGYKADVAFKAYVWVTDANGGKPIEIFWDTAVARPSEVKINHKIHAQGTLDVYNGTYEIKVKALEDVTIVELITPTYIDVDLAGFLPNPGSYEGKTIHISNAIVLSATSYNIKIGDSSYNITLYAPTKHTISPAVGDKVNASGYVKYYSGSWEVVIRANSTDFVEVAGTASGDYTLFPSIANLLANANAYQGTRVKVENVIVVDDAKFYYNSNAYVYIADEAGGPAMEIFWSSGSSKPATTLMTNHKVTVQGALSVYQGTWEICPSTPSDVTVIERITPTYTETTIENILSDPTANQGKCFTLRNVNVTSASASYNFNVSDGTNSLKIYTNPGGSGLASTPSVGTKVNVSGYFWNYKGAYQISIRTNSSDMAEISQVATITYTTVADINTLITDNAIYNNTFVKLANVTIESFKVGTGGTVQQINVTDSSVSTPFVVYVYSGSNCAQDIAVGGYISVQGYFTWYTGGGGYFEIKVNNNGSDSVVKL